MLGLRWPLARPGLTAAAVGCARGARRRGRRARRPAPDGRRAAGPRPLRAVPLLPEADEPEELRAVVRRRARRVREAWRLARPRRAGTRARLRLVGWAGARARA